MNTTTTKAAIQTEKTVGQKTPKSPAGKKMPARHSPVPTTSENAVSDVGAPRKAASLSVEKPSRPSADGKAARSEASDDVSTPISLADSSRESRRARDDEHEDDESPPKVEGDFPEDTPDPADRATAEVEEARRIVREDLIEQRVKVAVEKKFAVYRNLVYAFGTGIFLLAGSYVFSDFRLSFAEATYPTRDRLIATVGVLGKSLSDAQLNSGEIDTELGKNLYATIVEPHAPTAAERLQETIDYLTRSLPAGSAEAKTLDRLRTGIFDAVVNSDAHRAELFRFEADEAWESVSLANFPKIRDIEFPEYMLDMLENADSNDLKRIITLEFVNTVFKIYGQRTFDVLDVNARSTAEEKRLLKTQIQRLGGIPHDVVIDRFPTDAENRRTDPNCSILQDPSERQAIAVIDDDIEPLTYWFYYYNCPETGTFPYVTINLQAGRTGKQVDGIRLVDVRQADLGDRDIMFLVTPPVVTELALNQESGFPYEGVAQVNDAEASAFPDDKISDDDRR